jgi:hypothetical protein
MSCGEDRQSNGGGGGCLSVRVCVRCCPITVQQCVSHMPPPSPSPLSNSSCQKTRARASCFPSIVALTLRWLSDNRLLSSFCRFFLSLALHVLSRLSSSWWCSRPQCEIFMSTSLFSFVDRGVSMRLWAFSPRRANFLLFCSSLFFFVCFSWSLSCTLAPPHRRRITFSCLIYSCPRGLSHTCCSPLPLQGNPAPTLAVPLRTPVLIPVLLRAVLPRTPVPRLAQPRRIPALPAVRLPIPVPPALTPARSPALLEPTPALLALTPALPEPTPALPEPTLVRLAPIPAPLVRPAGTQAIPLRASLLIRATAIRPRRRRTRAFPLRPTRATRPTVRPQPRPTRATRCLASLPVRRQRPPVPCRLVRLPHQLPSQVRAACSEARERRGS